MAVMKCDECGQPATHAVQDSIRVNNWGTGCVERVPAGRPRYGCDAHRVTPDTLGTTNIPRLT